MAKENTTPAAAQPDPAAAQPDELDERMAQYMAKIDAMFKSAEDMKREAEDTLAAAEDKARAIVAGAAEKVAAAVPGGVKAMPVNKPAYLEEKVPIRLFKDAKDYKDPLYVCVNGENCVIERGVTVMVKRKFAQVIEQSEYQDYMTAMLMEQKSSEFEEDSKRHGL